MDDSSMDNDDPMTVNILLVDDKESNLLALETLLHAPNQHLVAKNSGSAALKYLLDNDVAVILLDVQMPGMDGLETAELIRQRERSQDIPIIFITATTPPQNEVIAAYKLGAVDYIFKPVVPEILKTKVAVFIDLYRKKMVLKQQKIEKEQEAEQLRSALETQLLLTGWQDNSITASLAGVAPLSERSPKVFSDLKETYESLLDAYLTAEGFGVRPPRTQINTLAEHIGRLCGGPRDVVELHLQSVEGKCKNVPPKRQLAFTVEGRLLALELMGFLVDYYRVKSLSQSVNRNISAVKEKEK